MNFLEDILAHKKHSIKKLKAAKPVAELEKSPLFSRQILSFSEFIRDPLKNGIIAEFKRKSPSKGIINIKSEIGQVIRGYSLNGASAVSVLTEEKFFGGKNNDIIDIRDICPLPVLRKDFIIDEYQVIESRSSGADAILLIAAALKKKEVLKLACLARSLDLQVLLEIHNEQETDAFNEYVDVVGVNNRDLVTFRVDTGISADLAPKIPEKYVKISESGISSHETIKQLKKAGFDGFLMGEIFMKTEDPAAAFSEFVKKL